MRSLAERQAQRFALLHAVYHASGGSPDELIDEKKLLADLGWNAADARAAVEYLVNEELITHKYYGPSNVSITHAGVREVEQAIASPQQKTSHFPPLIINHIQTMINSQIQQGTTGSIQHQNLQATIGPELKAFVELLRQQLPALALDQETEAEARGELATLEAQVASPRPKSPIIHESLRSLRTILEQVGGTIAASLLARLMGIPTG